MGHSGPEEGSEHYFAYHLEAVTGRSFVHGEVIALGVVLMSALQDNHSAAIRAVVEECGVRWRPEDLGIDRGDLRATLEGLKTFVREVALPYSVIDEADLGPDRVRGLIDSV